MIVSTNRIIALSHYLDIQFLFCFCIKTVENRVTVFFATYLFLLIHILYSGAFLKQCSGDTVRFPDSSSLIQ